ncbi:DMT family transporter [uncultured Paracoccus sp.]|uniref:DMT family transporter n=1 Tax=uncultured Paracoccus sp. TaxID=189685 RepID=UPI0025DB5D8B|nr:DMT family transporter [uncultured Paracoccus sp.]
MTSTIATRGVLLGFAAFAVFAFSDASVKLIDGRVPPIESAFFGALFAFCLLPFVVEKGDRWQDIFATRNHALWLLRFFSYPVGVIGSVTAFTHLTMAEAFVLIFLQPAFVTIISTLFLNEQVGTRRWGAVLIGFLGVLIVLRPGFRELSIGHLGALVAGLCGGLSVVIYRVAGNDDKRLSLFGAGMLGAVLICGLAMLRDFHWPAAQDWVLLAGYGLMAALANLLLMHAALRAPAAWVSPTQYSQMIWAIVLDYLLFSEILDMPMFVGILFITVSGMMTLMRELDGQVGEISC